jgi:PEP-CTERM motif
MSTLLILLNVISSKRSARPLLRYAQHIAEAAVIAVIAPHSRNDLTGARMKIRSLVHHAALTSALCLALALPTLAHSAGIFLIGDGFANGSDSMTLTATPAPDENPVPTGGFTGRVGPDPGPNPPTMNILFWCAELTQSFSFGTVYTDYTISPLTNKLLSQLFTEVGGSAGATATQTKSAAFQLSVWEILFEGGTYGGLNVSSGNFSATGDAGAIAQANTWLAALTASSAATTQLFLLASPDHQDFITDTPIPPSFLVPEPSPLPLLGAGLIALYFVTRRRAK